eukprot:6750930-Prymnesium_polylepis.1
MGWALPAGSSPAAPGVVAATSSALPLDCVRLGTLSLIRFAISGTGQTRLVLLGHEHDAPMAVSSARPPTRD